MEVVFYVLVSVISGVLGGMGMGGGTFLVPLLAVCFGVEQVFCQSTNVLCFLTLAIVCFVIYVIRKKKVPAPTKNGTGTLQFKYIDAVQ